MVTKQYDLKWSLVCEFFFMFCSPGVSLLAIVFEALFIFVTVVVKSVVMLDTLVWFKSANCDKSSTRVKKKFFEASVF